MSIIFSWILKKYLKFWLFLFLLSDFYHLRFSIDKRKSTYCLKAVALHSGSVDYGHYVALGKRDQNVK